MQANKKLTTADIERLNKLSIKIRKSILKMVYKSKVSHIGSALSTVELLTIPYGIIMKIDPKEPDNQKRDRFLLSKGHACTALYATLAELGYFNKNLLEKYSTNDSIFMSHINSEVPGIEFSTGSLGHALPVGVGMAFAALKKKEDYRTYVLLSDGELNEGSNWEAFLMAAHLKLNNLIAMIDVNKIQALGFTKEILDIEPIDDKLKSFGWETIRVNGHSLEEIYTGLEKLLSSNNQKPKVLIADTIKGKGISFMENKLKWHYSSPNEEEYKKALKELEKK